MKCPNCGAKNKAGMKYCKICGSILPENNNGFEDGDSQSSKKKTPKLLIVAIIVVSLVIIGIVAFLLINQLSNQTETGNTETKKTESVVATTKSNSATEETTVEETTQATTQAEIKAPNVTGVKSNDAYDKIINLGLKYKAEFDYSDNVPEDYVISQSPAEDSKLTAGETVTLKISRGSKPDTSSNNSSVSKANESSSNVTSGGDTKDKYGLNVSSRYISRSDISWMNRDEIQLAINEVYAKLGFRFTKGEEKKYFESMYWYNPDTTDMFVIEKRMNEYEYKNMKIMGAYRDSLPE